MEPSQDSFFWYLDKNVLPVLETETHEEHVDNRPILSVFPSPTETLTQKPSALAIHSRIRTAIQLTKRKKEKKNLPHECLEKTADGDYCEKSFRTPKELKNHLERMHSYNMDWECRFCDKAYSNKGTRDLHKRRIHDEKKRECPIDGCFWKCVLQGDLNQHLKRTNHKKLRVAQEDTSGMPLIKIEPIAYVELPQKNRKENLYCQICDIQYDKKNNYFLHMRRKHGEKNEKCFIEDCKAAFAYPSDLKHHIARKHHKRLN